MVTSTNPKRSCNITAPKPDVIGLLPDVPGGEPGLLPSALTGDDLKVWFAVPLYSKPELGQEKYELFVDDVTDAITTRYWNTPIEDTDRYLELPASWLRNNDGQHRIYYKTTIYNGAENCSFDLLMTLDTQAPRLADDSKLIFPSEVLPPEQLTAYYLEYEDEDKVRAGIPAYDTPKVGDVITWYWDRSSSGTTTGPTKVLTVSDIDKPLFIDIRGDWIRSQEDGDRYVWYTVADRAGNPPNGQSAVERLIVSAQPVPRNLPPPKVIEATEIGWPVRGTLNPINAIDGVNVVLHPDSSIHGDEVPQVQWGEEGTLGYYLADPVSPDTWEFKIPREYMAAHFGKVILVQYVFTDKKGKEHKSKPFTLTVTLYPKDRLGAPQSADGSPLRRGSVPPEGASITMIKWPFIAAGQQLMLRVEGREDASGTIINQLVFDRHEVTPGQAEKGILRGEALIEMAFLNRIRLDTDLVVKAYVSFDNGQTWNGMAAPSFNTEHFPWLRVKLVD
jgi:hypothetical protein